MSQPRQTRIDQFFKVVSNKNTGCGLKLSMEQFKQLQNTHRKSNKRNSTKIYHEDENEVQMEEEKSKSSQRPKRTSSFGMENSPKILKSNQSFTSRSPNKMAFPEISSQVSPNTSPRKYKYSSSPDKLSQRKSYFSYRIKIKTVQQAIENVNLVRQQRIVPNEFNLNSVYQSDEFSIVYSDTVDSNVVKLELKNIILPQENNANCLLMIVMDVFSNSVNCGYFSREELDLIFSLFTLSPESQMLFVRLLKRKLSWHRTSTIQYPEISNDLDSFFKELVQNRFFTSDIESMDTSELLNLLRADEVRRICQYLKINPTGIKSVLIERLLKYGNSSKKFFIGAMSPRSLLKTKILSELKFCVRLPENIINLLDRVITLLYPVQDPSESIADLFLTLTIIHSGEIILPPIEMTKSFPIFKNRSHLICFVESRNALKKILGSIEKKDWNAVKDLGKLAMKHLSKKQQCSDESSLPLHIRKFAPEFIWVKVLSKSIDAFKKSPVTIPEAVNILETLIENDKNVVHRSRGHWYSELALIEMHHRKNLERSAELTLRALQQDTLTEVDVSDLRERLRKLQRRKTGISTETKLKIEKAQINLHCKGLATLHADSIMIFGTMANRAEVGGKSKWLISTNYDEKFYGSVEMLAIQHYTTKDVFTDGLHCEGSLPVTLFTIFFWEELYEEFVPGAFVSKYQDAPLDLFTVNFFDNRKKSIKKKITFTRKLNLESFNLWMVERYLKYKHYRSVMPNTLFKNDQQFKYVVECLGRDGVTGICEKLASNFRLWRSGFPDLIVWNTILLKCKIVEVKGPGDTLSEKQKLWLQYLLHSLGIDVEVCHVKGIHRKNYT